MERHTQEVKWGILHTVYCTSGVNECATEHLRGDLLQLTLDQETSSDDLSRGNGKGMNNGADNHEGNDFDQSIGAVKVTRTVVMQQRRRASWQRVICGDARWQYCIPRAPRRGPTHIEKSKRKATGRAKETTSTKTECVSIAGIYVSICIRWSKRGIATKPRLRANRRSGTTVHRNGLNPKLAMLY